MIVICEKDPVKVDNYCIECFTKKTVGDMYFYDSRGPFCNTKCYSAYLNIPKNQIERVIFRGTMKDEKENV